MINKTEDVLEYYTRTIVARVKAGLRARFIDGAYFEDTRPGDRLGRIGIIGTRGKSIRVYYENWRT